MSRLAGLAAAIAVLTLAGLVALWPHRDTTGTLNAFGGKGRDATVTRVVTEPCQSPTPQPCRTLAASVGAERITIALGPVGANLPKVQRGARIRVARSDVPGVPATDRWQFIGLDRRGGLLFLAVALLVVSLLVTRLRGLLAALGVLASLALLLLFTIPAILAGRPALLVALVTALAVMFVTVGLTHGLSAPSLAAVLGITATLLVTCLLARLGTGLVHLDGQSSELAQYLATSQKGLSLEGIVLAGMLIGALGVLADTAVTQASAVVALRRANPALGARDLYREGATVGRDHLSATIHTLVLAYAGTSLPLLLLLHSSGVGAVDAIDTQDVAEPIAATLIGCIALVLAVPVTTLLSAVLVARTPPGSLPAGHHH